MREPVRILSDLHLGHRVSRIEGVSALGPLISGAGTVVFNGDTWQELPGPFRERGGRMLAELKQLCAEEGAETVFLPGNHDPGWPGAGWLDLADGRIIVSHGDALLRAGSPWKREILVAQARVEELWRRCPDAETDVTARLDLAREIARDLCSVEYPFGKRFMQRVWDALVPPVRALRMLEAWFFQGAAGAEFCRRYFPRAEVLVIGHFHWEGCWRNGRRLVINTGSFMSPGRAHWLEWQDGWLTRGEIDETPERVEKGRTLSVWRFGPAADCTSAKRRDASFSRLT
jgi:predicted phosphodiesterase